MPDKPFWFSHLAEILQQLDNRDPTSPPWITRPEVETLLQVGRRRAQQILLACPHHRLGRNLVVSPAAFREFILEANASSPAQAEALRRHRLAQQIQSWHQEFQAKPPLLVSAPASVSRANLDSLPPGILLSPNQLLVQYTKRQDLLEKLLALACALANDDSLDTGY